MDTATGIPLSVVVRTIEVGDVVPAREVVEQALANIEGHAVLRGLAVDRGFLDGDFLYWLQETKGINWVCPAKEKMLVTGETRDRVNAVLAAAQEKDSDGTPEERLATASRLARKFQTVDGVAFHEHNLGRNRQALLTATVAELYETDFYGPGGSNSSRVHSKRFRPTPLHATVVLNWPDRPPQDIADEREHDEDKSRGPVVILSAAPEPGRERYDRYDRRSLIENQVNREGKQHFTLGAARVRNANGMHASVFFSVLALLLWRVLLIEQEAAEEDDRLAEPLGIARYRRKLEVENRDKVMLWADGCFGIFDHRTFLQLAGLERT